VEEQEYIFGEPSFRTIRPEDLPEVAELLDVAFEGRWPGFPIRVSTLEHLHWKLDSPQVIPGGTTLLELDGRIVGYDGSVGRDVWLSGRRHPGWAMVDSTVHPQFQGRGLSKLHLRHYLARWADVQQPVALDEGSTHPRLNQSSGLGSERVRLANAIDVLTLPLDIAAQARQALRSPRSALKFARLLSKMLGNRVRWRSARTSDSSLTIRTIDSFDERADALWERARRDFDFAVVRDSQYLNWRYCDPRAGIYRVRAAERDGDLLGFAVAAAVGTDARIVDLLAAPGEAGLLRRLIDDVAGSARHEGAARISIQCPRVHPYREVLHRLGFVGSGSVPNIGFRPRNDSVLAFLGVERAARLHIAFGDTDSI